MKKNVFFTLSLVLLLSVGVAFAAKPDFNDYAIINPATGEEKNIVSLPDTAIKQLSGVYYLGKAVDKGREVEGYAFIRYKDGYAKPGTQCGNGVCEPGENANKCSADCGGGSSGSSCYGFLAKGAKWKTIESYEVNPANSRGLDGNFIAGNLSANIAKWESAASLNILGEGAITSDLLEADMASPDNRNEVYFGNIAEPGAIGITIVWGIFGGPPFARELVEWDQVYDDTDYSWSSTGEAGEMDFENIATHELGHSIGMGDLYESVCGEQTMYGYADYGETMKRTLESGDIQGINELY